MEQRPVQQRGIEVTADGHPALLDAERGEDTHAHGGSHRHLDALRDDAAQHPVQHPHARFPEDNGRIGLQRLVETEGAGSPLPAATRAALQHDFLTEGVRALPLLQCIDVGGGEVLVYRHPVFQVLVAGDDAEGEVSRLMLQVQTCIQQVAIVAVVAVVRHLPDVGLQLFRLPGGVGAALIEVGVAVLVAVFVVDVQVGFPVLRREVDGADASACRLSLVGALSGQGVAEEAALIVVEASGREGEPFREAMVVGQRGIVGVTGARAQAEVGSLIGEGRLGVYLNQPAHRIAPVKCALRAAQHVDTLHVGIAEVERRLVDIGDIVHVEAYGGGIDARADAADIDG